jgi:hypothetical protein
MRSPPAGAGDAVALAIPPTNGRRLVGIISINRVAGTKRPVQGRGVDAQDLRDRPQRHLGPRQGLDHGTSLLAGHGQPEVAQPVVDVLIPSRVAESDVRAALVGDGNVFPRRIHH